MDEDADPPLPELGLLSFSLELLASDFLELFESLFLESERDPFFEWDLSLLLLEEWCPLEDLFLSRLSLLLDLEFLLPLPYLWVNKIGK